MIGVEQPLTAAVAKGASDGDDDAMNDLVLVNVLLIIIW
jgi:hypothetical protein